MTFNDYSLVFAHSEMPKVSEVPYSCPSGASAYGVGEARFSFVAAAWVRGSFPCHAIFAVTAIKPQLIVFQYFHKGGTV